MINTVSVLCAILISLAPPDAGHDETAILSVTEGAPAPQIAVSEADDLPGYLTDGPAEMDADDALTLTLATDAAL